MIPTKEGTGHCRWLVPRDRFTGEPGTGGAVNVMAPIENHLAGDPPLCGCYNLPYSFLSDERELGMDDHYADVSLLTCTLCGQVWLRYLFELEAFTASGRWYLGAINAIQATHMTARDSKATLEALDWYFYGGSYFGGKIGRSSGRIFLDP